MDRDGIINDDAGYTWRIEDIRFREGIFELCAAAQKGGLAIVVVTNQAGIGRGYYTEEDFLRLMAWMKGEFMKNGIHIDAVEYCPDHPVHGVGRYKRDTPRRKPGPGMFLDASRSCGLDLSNSMMIGDKLSDVQAARAAGIAQCILMTDDSGAAQVSPEGTVVLAYADMAGATAQVLKHIRRLKNKSIGFGE